MSPFFIYLANNKLVEKVHFSRGNIAFFGFWSPFVGKLAISQKLTIMATVFGTFEGKADIMYVEKVLFFRINKIT